LHTDFINEIMKSEINKSRKNIHWLNIKQDTEKDIYVNNNNNNKNKNKDNNLKFKIQD
jgi:hypothetical protein